MDHIPATEYLRRVSADRVAACWVYHRWDVSGCTDVAR